jgi:hypothetical protein
LARHRPSPQVVGDDISDLEYEVVVHSQ